VPPSGRRRARVYGGAVADVRKPKPTVLGGVLAGTVVVVSLIVHLLVQSGMYLATTGASLARFRDYFVHDQLGYLAIVKNFSEGQFDSFEPDTETGANTYPRLYYEAIGLVARVTGWDPIVAWNVCGMAVQLLLVGLLAGILIGVSRRWWVGLLAPLPFMLGTFSTLTGTGWYTALESHAVIWGPFGVLHTLNGETVSLSLAAISCLLLGLLWLRPVGSVWRVVLTALICLLLGALANVQTYSFIAAVYLLAFGLAAWALLRGRSIVHIVLAVLSIALIPVVFWFGPTVAEEGGQLPTLVFGLLPAVPGMLALIVRSRGIVLIFCVAVVLGAAPQVVGTVTGLATGDPFLAYRVASNTKLGVPFDVGVTAAIALIVPLVLILIASIVRRRALWGAYAVGAGLAWVLLASNDVWGANAEPYRLWMDVFFLVAATILPIATLVVADLWRSRTAQPELEHASADPAASVVQRASEPVTVTAAEEPPRRRDLRRREANRPKVASPRGRRASRWVAVAGTLICLAVAGVSLGDWWAFYQSKPAQALLVTDSPRDRVITELAVQSAAANPGTLVMVDSCIDPRVLKVTSGVPVAYYHLGMAWPTEYQAVGDVIQSRLSGSINREAALAGKATQVLSDSACADDWANRYADVLSEQTSLPYTNTDGTTGTITLWGLR